MRKPKKSRTIKVRATQHLCSNSTIPYRSPCHANLFPRLLSSSPPKSMPLHMLRFPVYSSEELEDINRALDVLQSIKIPPLKNEEAITNIVHIALE
ncbi:hypothetical protein SAMN03159341_12452 [Paenibacillus sp. 1_12]|nr:hypothetical protein SAMN03159341_12452 [Paenibacillus sp. 1_12]